MIVVFKKFCDRCGRQMKEGAGADVLKHTVNFVAHPTRHLCERCYAEVFAKQIAKEGGAK